MLFIEEITKSAAVRYIWGKRDTIVTPLKRAEEIHQEVKDSQLLLVDGGHTVLYQKPNEVVKLIVNSI